MTFKLDTLERPLSIVVHATLAEAVERLGSRVRVFGEGLQGMVSPRYVRLTYETGFIRSRAYVEFVGHFLEHGSEVELHGVIRLQFVVRAVQVAVMAVLLLVLLDLAWHPDYQTLKDDFPAIVGLIAGGLYYRYVIAGPRGLAWEQWMLEHELRQAMDGATLDP